MVYLQGQLERLWREQEGQSLTEYGTIVTLVAVGVLGLLTLLYEQVAGIYSTVAAELIKIAAAP